MREFNMTLAEAFSSPLTTSAELDAIAAEAAAAGRKDVARTARKELSRRRRVAR